MRENADAAREVVGSLIDYKDGDGCPMCDAPVLTDVAVFHCTACAWQTPKAESWRTMYDKKLLERLSKSLIDVHFSEIGKVGKAAEGATVTFRRFNTLVTDAN